MSALTKSTPNNIGITLLRVVLGVVFLLHGWQKFNTFTIAGTQASFAEMGVPAAEIVAPIVTVLEIAGGVALILGLFTRPFALLLAVVSLGALATVHFSAGFFASDGGYEFVLLLAAAALALALIGPGRFSVDRRFRGKLARLH